MSVELRERVRQAAFDVGFDAAGVARAGAAPHPGSLRRWLSQCHHAGMHWMTRRVDERESPQIYAPATKTIISLGLNSYTSDAVELPVAMYARGIDYHLIFTERMTELTCRLQDILPGCRTIACCDTSPVLERAWAESAGIGWIGKAGQLISVRFGTWLLLGEILLDREIEPDLPHPDMCGTCVRCVRACPTGAINSDRTVDSRRCISYLTIEHRGEIPAEHQEAMRGHLFGCDDCLLVCPFNRFQREASEVRLRPGIHLERLRSVFGMDEAAFRDGFRDSALARSKLAGLRRNWGLAMGAEAGEGVSAPQWSF